MDGAAAWYRGRSPHAGHEQRVGLRRDLDVLRLDAGQRDHDQHFPVTGEHVDRRLPARPRLGGDAGLEELALQLLGPLDHRAGFGPHPASGISRHRNLAPEGAAAGLAGLAQSNATG